MYIRERAYIYSHKHSSIQKRLVGRYADTRNANIRYIVTSAAAAVAVADAVAAVVVAAVFTINHADYSLLLSVCREKGEESGMYCTWRENKAHCAEQYRALSSLVPLRGQTGWDMITLTKLSSLLLPPLTTLSLLLSLLLSL